MHRTAAILAIGDELTTGQCVDTNSACLSRALLNRGLTITEHATVPDDAGIIADSIGRLASRADVLLVTGGLGPTADDLTRDGLALAMQDELVRDGAAVVALRAWYETQDRPMPETNLVQALRPSRARCLPNSRGTAPGLHARLEVPSESRGRLVDVFCLPGPPRELTPMLEIHVLPEIRSDRRVRLQLMQVCGIGESDAAAKLGDLLSRDRRPVVGITASVGMLTLRIRDEQHADEPDEACTVRIAGTIERVRDILGPYVHGLGERTLAGSVLEGLGRRCESLGVVESCTGGMIGEHLTSVPGSSAVFLGGLMTYTNALKVDLAGVPAGVIEEHGAVSEACARAMARGGRIRLGADWALSVTGVAGPGGGSEAKPVGTVWIGLAGPGGIEDARRFQFMGERDAVRRWSVSSALSMLHLHLAGSTHVRLLRQSVP